MDLKVTIDRIQRVVTTDFFHLKIDIPIPFRRVVVRCSRWLQNVIYFFVKSLPFRRQQTDNIQSFKLKIYFGHRSVILRDCIIELFAEF